MNLSQLLEIAKENESFKNFIKENPDSFFTAAFIVLDDSGKESYQLDFFIPAKNKIAISSYPFNEFVIQEDDINESKQLNIPSVEVSDLKERVEKIKLENNLEKIKINKIIAILKDDVWNLTCLSPTLDILKIQISSDGECIRCQKSSLMDFVVKK